jgi:DNA polymerase, archaea type
VRDQSCRALRRYRRSEYETAEKSLREAVEHTERTGFIASVLSSLLNLRIETKRLKKTNPDYKGIDSVLKWMLVTCFGYTGYRNAKFGQIQVHERITETSR